MCFRRTNCSSPSTTICGMRYRGRVVYFLFLGIARSITTQDASYDGRHHLCPQWRVWCFTSVSPIHLLFVRHYAEERAKRAAGGATRELNAPRKKARPANSVPRSHLVPIYVKRPGDLCRGSDGVLFRFLSVGRNRPSGELGMKHKTRDCIRDNRPQGSTLPGAGGIVQPVCFLSSGVATCG